MEGNAKFERTLTIDGTNVTYEFNLEDLILLKRLIDRESFELIETYGDEVKKMKEYQQLLYLRQWNKDMIDTILNSDWADLKEDLKTIYVR